MSGSYEKLTEQVLAYVSDEMESLKDDFAIGDSPIEKLMYGALVAMTRFGASEFRHVEMPTKQRTLAMILDEPDPLTLVVEPQAQLEGWRVDFLIHAWEFGRVSGRPQWRRLIVECDGHAYHERTKQQAARDRSRDREFQIRGFGVLRFTGAEIHNDPLGCARQVSEWGTMGW